ncbi:hypothetical protein [Pseudobacillus badius]|uniref:hypothetical protein n=1 Tax=Bacillus badius TaxID=1455 RepID=UPI0007B38E60|nr:hypothetical protein [Bacillus badius]KZR57905.1 hypothetical protein A3781_19200 [Bacillus badius]
MLFYPAGGLLVAWILTLFGFDHLALSAVEEMTGNAYSLTVYYFAFAVLGLIWGFGNKFAHINKKTESKQANS